MSDNVPKIRFKGYSEAAEQSYDHSNGNVSVGQTHYNCHIVADLKK